MSELPELRVLFVAGFGPIVQDHRVSLALYKEVLGLPLEAMPQDPTYYHAERLDGVKHFALWPLANAARSCFGTETWPADIPRPSAWLEFEVADVAAAANTVKARGYRLLVDTKEEPWGQTVARLLSPEGILIGLTRTPWLHSASS